MAGEGKGWISLYRSIQDHWLWQEKPFSKGQAWMDLLLSANHQDKRIVFDSNLIEVKRGQFITSIRKLCDRWGWSNSKVKKFLDTLQSDEMIHYKSDTKKTTINIVNYSIYQDMNFAKNDTEAFQSDTLTETSNTNSSGQFDTKINDLNHEATFNKNYKKSDGLNKGVSTASKDLSDTETSQKHYRSDTETSQKHTNNNDNNVNNDNKYINNKEEINPMEVYQNNIYPMPGVIEIEGIKDWSNTLGNELVVYAINIAAKSNVRKWNFIEKILIDWDKNGIKTLDQAKAYSENRKKGGQKENDRDRTDNTKDKVKYNFSRFGG